MGIEEGRKGKVRDNEEKELCISSDILSFASRLREISNELLMTQQEAESLKMLIGQGEVYVGTAREDIYFYYERLSEMILKLSDYYRLGDKSAREIYNSMTNLDVYLAGLFHHKKGK